MHNDRMHHAILGAGGIGGLLGACLAHTGERVTMVVRENALANFPDQLHLESTFGTFDEPVAKACIVPSADVLWITVKATHLEHALHSIPQPNVANIVVPLLNGIDHIAELSQRYGRERVIPATIAGESEGMAPGRIWHPSPFVRLNISARGEAQLGDVVGKLGSLGFTCRFLEDERTLMWSKISMLAPIALSTTAAAAPIGEILSDAQRAQDLEACIRETCAVGSAEGATLDGSAALNTIRNFPPGTRSSMQKDVARGNPPELDAIAGPILRGGKRHGIPVPATEKLAAEVARRAGLS